MTVGRQTYADGLIRAEFPKKAVSESTQNYPLFRFVVRYRSVAADAGISRGNHSVTDKPKPWTATSLRGLLLKRRMEGTPISRRICTPMP